MNTSRRVAIWFVVAACVVNAINPIVRYRAIFFGPGSIPLWLWGMVAFQLLCCAVFAIGTWSVLTERPPVRIWGLVWITAFLVMNLFRAALFRHIGLFGCLALAVGLEQLVFFARYDSAAATSQEVPR